MYLLVYWSIGHQDMVETHPLAFILFRHFFFPILRDWNAGLVDMSD
jgi:transposase